MLRCTEGFTAGLPGQRRALLPMNSSMIVTEPLGDEAWQAIGWDGCETLGDEAHAYMYAQRTADGRIALGGRGVPYRFGSGIDHDGAIAAATIAQLGRILRRMFPAAAAAGLEHAWCGVLGVPRDWCATVTLDPPTGLGWAGGYTGHGVAAVQPGRPDARRPGPRRPQPADHAALGRPPLPRWEPSRPAGRACTASTRSTGWPTGWSRPGRSAAHLGAGPGGRPDLRDPALDYPDYPASAGPRRTAELVALGIAHDHVAVVRVLVAPDEPGAEPGQPLRTSAAWSSVYRSRCI